MRATGRGVVMMFWYVYKWLVGAPGLDKGWFNVISEFLTVGGRKGYK